MSDVEDAMVDGISDRLRNLLLAMDRQDRLESATHFTGWLARQRRDVGFSEAGREICLRALRVASDPTNYRVLTLLGPTTGLSVAELIERTGLKRVAMSERINDLAQVGLASREMIGDHVRSTALATGLVKLVESVSDRAAKRVKEQLADGATPGAGS